LKQNTDWKTRYQGTIKELDAKQSEWQSLEKILRKAVARLSIVGRGLDKKLDKQLELIQSLSQDKQDQKLSNALEGLSQVVTSVKNSSKTSDKKQRSAPASNSNSFDEIISTLLERLSFIQGASDTTGKIRAEVVDGAEDNNWPETLNENVAAISDTLNKLNQEKRELEIFFMNVTVQIGEIARVVSEDHEDHLSEHRETISLQSLMQEGVAKIRDKVNAAEDINQLKTAIARNIDLIREGVDDFVGRANTRHEAIEIRNKNLSTKMKQMEKETALLQKKLIENREKLLYDSLTGVHSRLAYDEYLEQELARWKRYGSSFSYVVLDIDNFKNINDKYGHSAGDKTLQIIAKMMLQKIRKSDFVFRIGGEEFVLLLTNTNVSQAEVLVEKLRKAVNDRVFHFNQKQVSLSMSAGITETRDEDDVESIFERADGALYRAKNSGRNCQIVA